jgi:membrane protein implicated in regulation of membrane protease activity
METVYLICLIFGGFFLAVSIFAGTETDADFALTAGADIDVDLDGDVSGEGVTSTIQYFSFRNIIFFVAFFGLTGLILSKLGTPSIATFVVASSLGLFSAGLGHKVMAYLKQSEAGGSVNMRDLEGVAAKVTVDVTKSRRGKITVSSKDRIFQLLAQVAEEASRDHFKFGDSVTIIKVEDNTAFVAESEFIQ